MKLFLCVTPTVACFALCACGGAPGPAAPAPSPARAPAAPPSGTAAPTPSLPKLDTACAEIEKKQRAAIAQAKAPEGGGEAVTDADLALLPKGLGQCVRSGRGAWAFVIEELAAAPSGEKGSFDGQVYFVHVNEHGAAVKSSDLLGMLSPGTPGSSFSDLRLRTRISHDLDGDGDDELLLCADFSVHQQISGTDGQTVARPRTGCKIITRDKDLVLDYANALAYEIEDFKDVDQDGRPDLLTRTPFASIAGLDDEDCVLRSCNTAASRGPQLAAHSEADGTFSFAHEAAVKFAAQACPSRPKSIFTSSGDAGSDFAAGVDRFVCALVWGATEAELAPELKKGRAAMCRTASQCLPFDDLAQKAADRELAIPRMKR
jgi:hypothetical protein